MTSDARGPATVKRMGVLVALVAIGSLSFQSAFAQTQPTPAQKNRSAAEVRKALEQEFDFDRPLYTPPSTSAQSAGTGRVKGPGDNVKPPDEGTRWGVLPGEERSLPGSQGVSTKDVASAALGRFAAIVLLTLVLSYLSYKLVAPKGAPGGSSYYARKWAAWGLVLAFVVATKELFHRRFLVDGAGLLVMALLMFGVGGAIAGAIVGRLRAAKQRPDAPALPTVSTPAPRPESSSTHGDAVYAIAADELSEGAVDKATWARAVADADGNAEMAKARYIRYRVERLQALR